MPASLPRPAAALEALDANEARDIVAEALATGRLGREPANRFGASLGRRDVLDVLLEGAFRSKLENRGEIITVSRNVFIPLTNLCRNRCTYCTFAKSPDSSEARTYGLEEVAEVVRSGVVLGCSEALFCLGDKPEIAYRSHRAWLAQRGYSRTSDLLLEACRVAFEGGMLPHTNAGILSAEEMTRLRPWNASMGLMLETTSERLRGRGAAHYWAPDKDPAVRLRMHEEAGRLRIPFTSGILLGIGENDAERVDSLLAIRSLGERFGHIQETIIQPFHPKPGTKMAGTPALGDDEVVGWVAIARLVLGPGMNVQAPPNLAPGMLERLACSGLNDWGGVSPMTADFINPEAPWPAIEVLRERTERSGQKLRDRGPVYPEWILERPEFFDPQVRAVLPRFANDEGFARRPDRQSREEAA